MQLLVHTAHAGEKEDEGFGMNDDDWQVYRTMATHVRTASHQRARSPHYLIGFCSG